ncbi:auxin efflux carrier protein [Fluviicola taffensis DSM 16823]|uniref:Auxin efflux carrier protein n=1 Tax=Fluviicola taffensis (strain DSM 16823 / NCIMB 13979 / RW262) TaxID=755732 RepID=F2IEW7_FLUTR|nr:auxin efflux carrier protein [Fluviicola taffensis DSM 16823]
MEFINILDVDIVESNLTVAQVNRENHELTSENKMQLFFLIALVCIILIIAYLNLKEK